MYALLLHTGAVEREPSSDNEYPDWEAYDFVICGAISFFLTILNIMCIWISGIGMFWFKEVAPLTTKNTFWTRDVKAVRALNRQQKIYKGADAKVLQEGLRAALQVATKKKLAKNNGEKKKNLTDAEKSKKRVNTPKLAKRQEDMINQLTMGHASSPMDGAFSSTQSLINRRKSTKDNRSNLMNLFMRPENKGGETGSVEDGEQLKSSVRSLGNDLKFTGDLGNMADLLFTDGASSSDSDDSDDEDFGFAELWHIENQLTHEMVGRRTVNPWGDTR